MYKIAPELVKLKRLGVSIEVKPRSPEQKDKKEILLVESIKPDEDGLIVRGENNIQRFFSLAINAPARDDLAVVIIQGRRSELIDRLSPTKIEYNSLTFIRNVSTHPVFGGYSTKPQDNSVRIVSVKKGKLRIFSVAVTTRLYNEENGAYDFLVVQEMYRAKLFRNRDDLVAEDEIVTDTNEYPGFNRWEAMQWLVGKMISPTEKQALPILKPKARVLAKDPELNRSEGQVIFFDVNKGFGFAKTQFGNRYFNWKQAETEDRLPYFFAGQKIKYSHMVGDLKQKTQLVIVAPTA